MSVQGRDIAPVPEIVDSARRAACERDFRAFCEAYFPFVFSLGWSADHIKVIGQLEESILSGGLFATAMPRGSGKTSLAETACIWAILYAHRRFIVLIGSDEGHSLAMMESIKTELETNERLQEDFPETVYPIACLEGIAHRCNGQLCDGERTLIGWTSDEVVMPTIPGSRASGSIIKVRGITGGVRGMKHKTGEGASIRPDLVIVDDPQTDASANSPSQCETRERILAGAILGLAGPGKKISGIMPCTVIRPGDMADRILDRQLHPEWNGTRTKMVYSFPSNEKLWEEYARIRAESLRSERGGRDATEFYAANREEMDRGARVAWEARHDPDELSAIQHAMNLKLRDERAFYAEYQNEPLAEVQARSDDLTADQIAGKVNRMSRGEVGTACNRLTAMIDVQASLLFYVVVAWEDDFTGQVVDYGCYPDQRRAYFTLRDAKQRLAEATKAPGLEGQLYAGLEALTQQILGREWLRDDGAMLKVEKCLIDANWGDSTALIYRFARQSAHSALILPSHGKYVGAASLPMSEYSKRPGEKVGHNWRLSVAPGQRMLRRVIFDSNFWKSFVHTRLSVPMGSRGCLSIFGQKPSEHRLFADHLTAEHRVRTQGRGREVDEWKIRPDRPDNHWWDCLVGCAVAASVQGVTLADGGEAAKMPAKKRMSFKEAYEAKWGAARA